jgi:hypothetical protein
MADPVVTVAKFSNALEAELARNFLESHGIPAQVGGAEASTLQVGALGGLAQLYVRESDAEHAAELLRDHFEKAQLDDDWMDQAEDSPNFWVCPQCGASVSDELAACDACETTREAIQTKDRLTSRRRRPRPAPTTETGITKPGETTAESPGQREQPELDIEPDELDRPIVAPDISLYTGDAIAARALLMALLGLCCGVLTWYSVFLLLQLALGNYELSPQGKVRCYWALALVVVHFALLTLYLYSRIAGR